jgi:hypothetical protein
MKNRSLNPKQLIGLILILSGLAMMFVGFVLLPLTSLNGLARYAIAVAGLMDMLFGAAFVMAGRK